MVPSGAVVTAAPTQTKTLSRVEYPDPDKTKSGKTSKPFMSKIKTQSTLMSLMVGVKDPKVLPGSRHEVVKHERLCSAG